jgi:MSHA biogenesis protein MshL
LSAIGSIAASITLLEKFGKTKVISSPKLMVLNNQTAVLKVVDNLVYFTIQSQISQSSSGTAGTNLQSVTTTANTVPVGVVMTVTPQINDGALVSLDVRPTISRVLSYIEDPNPQLGSKENRIVSAIPQIQVREMESVLNVASGSIAVLGGLMQDEIRNNTDAVPGLSKIPGAGVVFKGKNDATQKTELVIFIRPTVVPNASLESEELQSFKQYLPAQQLQDALEAVN